MLENTDSKSMNIEITTNKFVTEWNSITKYFRVYQLDFTWPSITLIDYILEPISRKLELDEHDVFKINGAAGYIASFVTYTWGKFPNPPAIKIDLESSTTPSVIITARDKKSDSLLFELNLSETLIKVLQNENQPFRFFPMTERHLPKFFPRIALLTNTLLLGIHPDAKGSWSEPGAKLDDQKREAIQEVLAESTAKHYRKRFPEENIGANKSLYQGLILFPPAGHLEPFPYTRSTLALTKRLLGEITSEEEMTAFLGNALRTGDDILSHTALAILAALKRENPDEHTILNIQSRQSYAPILTPAINLASQIVGKDFNWFLYTLAGKESNDPEKLLTAEKLLAEDFNLGLIPALRLPSHFAKDEKIALVINAIFFGQYDEARKALEELTKDQTTTPDELKIQLAHLYLILNQPTKARDALSNVINPKLPIYREASLHTLVITEGIQVAIPFIKTALEEIPTGIITRSLGRELLRYYYDKNDYKAIIELATMLTKNDHNLDAEVYLLRALHAVGDSEAEARSSRLRRIVPFDLNVFFLSLREAANEK